MSIVANVMPVKDQNSMANNVDPDEMAHYEMSRLIMIYIVCTRFWFGLQAWKI